MNHLIEEQLLDAYYGDLPADLKRHLNGCDECRTGFERLKETLDAVREFPGPERGAGYGGEVWARILPKIPVKKPRQLWWRWWMMAPAFAALLTVAFLAGRFTERAGQPAGISDRARERVLLISLSDHLESSEIILAELANAEPGSMDMASERDRARELVGANRLLRQTALRVGDTADAAVLDDLERVLLDVANGPAAASPEEVARLQQRIEQRGLLFKVRITSTDSRARGLRL